MKTNRSYQLFFLLLVVSFILAGCTRSKQLNERITLWRNDRIPYGTWYAFEQLSYLFPAADIHINKRSPDPNRRFILKDRSGGPSVSDYHEEKRAYIIIAPVMDPDAEELAALFQLASTGNHIFISSFSLGKELLDSMHLEMDEYAAFYTEGDSLVLSMHEPTSDEIVEYRYPGRRMDSYFTHIDSSITTVIGNDSKGRPDFVRFTYEGGGSLYIHLAPLAFSNFFLLHKQNKDYYEKAFSFLPRNVGAVYWDDYFRYNTHGRSSSNNDFSALGWVMKQKGLKEAIWLSILLMLFIYLFESKRKQRIIPLIAPLKNTSLDFVKTIGRLYFQRRDNRNLAMKLKTHFLDLIKTRYNLQTSTHDENFVNRLAYKSGYNQDLLNQIMYGFKMAEEMHSLADEELMELNQKLEKFQKHTL